MPISDIIQAWENPQKNGVNVYVTKSFKKDIPYKVLTFENTSNNNYDVTVGIK